MLSSGNQENLPKPQISYHSQCLAFLLGSYCPWNRMTCKALHILDPGPTFLSFPTFFSMLLHTYLPFLNAFFISCAFSDIHTIWVALAPLALLDSASHPLGLILEPFPLGNLCLNHPVITPKTSFFHRCFHNLLCISLISTDHPDYDNTCASLPLWICGSRVALYSRVTTCYMWLLQFTLILSKVKKLISQVHWPHCKGSGATWLGAPASLIRIGKEQYHLQKSYPGPGCSERQALRLLCHYTSWHWQSFLA